eukprot:1159321-Pelagomonas_calceolata.AAC.1
MRTRIHTDTPAPCCLAALASPPVASSQAPPTCAQPHPAHIAIKRAKGKAGHASRDRGPSWVFSFIVFQSSLSVFAACGAMVQASWLNQLSNSPPA